ncbi:MAG: metallophosphoesterase [Planctomycetota bacterium]
MNGRRWLRRGLLAAAFGALWLNVADDPPLRTAAYVMDVAPTTATVGLITAAPAASELTVRDEAGAVVATARVTGPQRRHQLRVAGLQPGRRYGYDVTSGGERYAGVLRTPAGTPDEPVRFAVLGDSGGQPWWVWLQRTPLWHWPARLGWFADAGQVTQMGEALAAWQPDFVVHLGDVIYPKGQQAHYMSGFFRPFAPVLRDAPFYAVLGNHDVMDAGGRQLLANLRTDEQIAATGGRNLSIARGPVRVLVIDGNGERFDAAHPTHAFLARELAAATEPWLVVAGHFPVRSASRQRDRADLLLALLPLLSEHGVSLYLSGHDHAYQRFGEPGGDEPVLVVSGGGGKDLYEVRPHPRAAKLASAFHWCGLEVRGRSLQVRAQDVGGAPIDAFDLPLPAGEALARIRRQNPARGLRIDAWK